MDCRSRLRFPPLGDCQPSLQVYPGKRQRETLEVSRMRLEPEDEAPSVHGVPGFPQQHLNDAERRQLDAALARIERAEVSRKDARVAFAHLVRKLGISA